MKLTLNNVMQRINQILNYPSVAYEDISHFFDHAIAELNTILKVGIPSVSDLVTKNTLDITLQTNTVMLSERPTYGTLLHRFESVPTEAPENTCMYGYYADGSYSSRKFYVWDGVSWNSFNSLYGVFLGDGNPVAYVATFLGTGAYWVESDAKRTLEFDFCEYLTEDWLTLFVIPYVCFKFTVRNGGDGALFCTEFTQGLQQLQTSYDVPNTVVLSEVAGIPAYAEIVSKNLNNLSKRVPTQAITDSMRIGTVVNAVFEDNVTGGWGV